MINAQFVRGRRIKMMGILETIILIALTIFFTLVLLLCSIVIYKLIKDILKDLKKESDNK